MRGAEHDLGHPAFRRVETHPVVHEGRRGLVLIDPLGVIEEPVFLPEALLPIVGRFDGRRSLAQIRAGVPGLSAGTLDRIVADLDEHLVLDSPRFRSALQERAREFGSARVRPASHAGSAGYPTAADACRQALARIVPGVTPTRPPPRGLIAPHIDLERGRDGYAAAYGRLAAAEPADLYVVFGTGHQGPAAPVTGLSLDWQTPLGRVTTDRAFVAAVHAEIGAPDPVDLWLHRGEHSIEFQVLFLQQVLGERPFEVAGFLCGQLPSANGDPSEEDYVRRLVRAFRTAAHAAGKRVCWIAGADLAHVGPAFGDDAPADEATAARLDRAERARLAHLGRGDPGAFHRAVTAGGNPDRVCGTTPIFLAAALAEGGAELLHYGQARADDGAQIVTYCAAAFG